MTEFDVVEFPETDHVTEGDVAPELTEQSRVLLVFYPMNGSDKSMYTWTEIRDRGWDGDGLTVVGVSISQPYDQHAFLHRLEIDYALFSDPTNGVAAEYGIVHDLDGMTGVTEPRPAVFLLEGDREVEYAWIAQKWPELPPYDEIARFARDVS